MMAIKQRERDAAMDIDPIQDQGAEESEALKNSDVGVVESPTSSDHQD